jgi:hypothetical protein
MDSSGLSPTVAATAAAAEFEPEASRSSGRIAACKAGALPLSYEPIMNGKAGVKNTLTMFILVKRIKEVIQPQVPLRLPCDDLTHLTELRFTLIKKWGFT